MNVDNILTVYFDGTCPLCRSEIDWYRRQRGAHRIVWIDVSALPGDTAAPGLSKVDALARFHVQLPDGSLYSGARAFTELWSRLPRLRRLGRMLRQPWLVPALETGYRAYLRLRPAIQRLAGEPGCRTTYPRWLARDLRSDHAGETGAVAIYRGVLAVTRNADLGRFAARHLQTELRHLAVMERLVPEPQRSRLLPVWRTAGYLTGALPALFGPAAVYATIDAVESFVDRHYAAQIEALTRDNGWDALRADLAQCWQDELAHRDEARAAADAGRGFVLRGWLVLVSVGSRIGVWMARRV